MAVPGRRVSLPGSLTVIFAVPKPVAVITPFLSTVAIDGALEVYVKALEHVAVMADVAP